MMFTSARAGISTANILAVLLFIQLLLVGCDSSQSAVSDLLPSEGHVEVEGGKVWFKIVGKGDATPLLLIHGGPGSSSSYLEIMTDLANDRPVIFYDQLGWGKSDHTDDSTLWTVERFAAEVNLVRNALGLEETYIYGHSWGATLALEAYVAQKEGVLGLILESPYVGNSVWVADAQILLSQMPRKFRDAIRRHEAAGTTDSEEYQLAVKEYNLRHGCRARSFADQRCKSDGGNERLGTYAYGTSEWILSGAWKDHDSEPMLGEVAVPTLFVSGRFDKARPETLARFHARVSGSELSIIEDASHHIMLEQPDKHNQVIRAFLAKTDAATSAR